MKHDPGYTMYLIAHGDHPLQRAPDCCRGAIVGIDKLNGRIAVIPAACHRWACPACAQRKAAQIYERLSRAKPERHITLTCDPALHEGPLAALDVMKQSLRKLAHQLRNPPPRPDGAPRWGPFDFEYCAIWERHKSGYPHVHLAQHGSYIPQALISKLWRKLTGAYIVHIKAYELEYYHGHHWTKYFLKQIPHTASMYSGYRMVSFSNHYDRNGRDDQVTPSSSPFTWNFVPLGPSDILDLLVNIYKCADLETDETFAVFAAGHLDVPDGPLELVEFFELADVRRRNPSDLPIPRAPPTSAPVAAPTLFDL